MGIILLYIQNIYIIYILDYRLPARIIITQVQKQKRLILNYEYFAALALSIIATLPGLIN